MKKLNLIFILLIIFSTLISCARPHYLEEVGLIIAAGYDRLEKDRIRATVIYHNFDPESSEPVQVMSSTGKTSKGIRQRINLESNKKLVSGQIRVALFGEKTARKGIMEIVDTLARDPSVGTMVYLAVAKESAEKLLTYNYEHIDNVGSYIFQMLEQNIEGEQLVSHTLHEFLHDYYSEGVDPKLPYLEIVEGKIMITGIAVFKNDQLVEVFPIKNSFCIKLIRDRFKMGSFEVTAKDEGIKKFIEGEVEEQGIHISFDHLNSKSKVEIEGKNPVKPKFKITIKMEARLQEVSEEIDLSNNEAMKALEKSLNICIEKNITEVIKSFQEAGVDPIGFGKYYRSSVRGENFSREEWEKIYKEATFSVKSDSKILRTGILY